MHLKSSNKIYDSIPMYNKNGKFLTYISEKRANWYIERDLAVNISKNTTNEESLIIQLTFENKGNDSTIDYYSQKFENKCVVCGVEENLTKHHVIPYMFRSRFPKQYKNHNHHDVLAVCDKCHAEYELTADKYKQDIAKSYGFSLSYKATPEESENKKIISAKKLFLSPEKLMFIPRERIFELRELSKKTLHPSSPPKEHYGELIVNELIKNNSIDSFIISWRKHFLEQAQPKFLPNTWDVNFRTKADE